VVVAVDDAVVVAVDEAVVVAVDDAVDVAVVLGVVKLQPSISPRAIRLMASLTIPATESHEAVAVVKNPLVSQPTSEDPSGW